MALADLSEEGAKEIYALFTYRFSKKTEQSELKDELQRMAGGSHFLVDRLPRSKRNVVRNHLHHFLEVMPSDFDLHGASIGNLVLTAGYMKHDRCLDCVIDEFSKLAAVRGSVRPVMDLDLHLAAELEDGTIVCGQHRLTGKETSPLSSKIVDLWQTSSLDSSDPVRSRVSDDVRELIGRASLICYPVGSFYTSVIANLLPDGVGEAVAANPCPKLFIPNPGGDPELLGHTVHDQVRAIRRYLSRSGAPDGATVLNRMLVDPQGEYPGGVDVNVMKSLGVTVVEARLLTKESYPIFSSPLLAKALFTMAG